MTVWNGCKSTKRTNDNMFFTLSLWMVFAVFGIQPSSSKMGPSKYDWDPIENHTNYHLLYWDRDCGQQLIPLDAPSSYISGGGKTVPGQYPWVVLLKPTPCAGSILNNLYILTAARCRLVTEVVFQYSDSERPFAQTRNVAELTVHDSYYLQNDEALHDIMLVRVDREIEFTNYARPICMVPPGYRSCLDESQGVHAVGWGQEGPELRNINEATSLYMNMYHYLTCEIAMSSIKRQFNRKYQLCTHYITVSGVSGAMCDGDLGAPLFKVASIGESSTRAYQLGVYSYGPPCHSNDDVETLQYFAKTPVYSKLSYYILWVLDNIKEKYRSRPHP